MTLEFKALETFVTVAALRSFHRAAERLNTTQPAVSQRIAGLETLLGRRLLDRSARGVGLTEAGRLLLGHAEALLGARAALVRAVADPTALTGTLRLGVSETVVHTFLSAFVDGLTRAHPRLQLEIEVDITPSLKARLLEHELDLAFLVGPLGEPGLRELPLRRERLGWFAAPGIAAPFGAQASTQLPILTFARNTRPFATIAALAARRGGARIHGSSSLLTVMRMAVGGLGVAAVPEVLAREEVAAGRLVRLDGPALPALGFVACWREGPLNDFAGEAARMAVAAATRENDAATAPRAPRRPAGRSAG